MPPSFWLMIVPPIFLSWLICRNLGLEDSHSPHPRHTKQMFSCMLSAEVWTETENRSEFFEKTCLWLLLLWCFLHAMLAGFVGRCCTHVGMFCLPPLFGPCHAMLFPSWLHQWLPLLKLKSGLSMVVNLFPCAILLKHWKQFILLSLHMQFDFGTCQGRNEQLIQLRMAISAKSLQHAWCLHR